MAIKTASEISNPATIFFLKISVAVQIPEHLTDSLQELYLNLLKTIKKNMNKFKIYSSFIPLAQILTDRFFLFLLDSV
jgi:hypothetical protein